jgi:hypothetical protein
VSICSLNVKTTAADGDTPLAPVVGTVETMTGCAVACHKQATLKTMVNNRARRRRAKGVEDRFMTRIDLRGLNQHIQNRNRTAKHFKRWS